MPTQGKWRACIHQTGDWEGQGGQPTRETLVTLTLSELPNGQTQMNFHQAFFDFVELKDGHNRGWRSSFDRLNDFINQLKGSN